MAIEPGKKAAKKPVKKVAKKVAKKVEKKEVKNGRPSSYCVEYNEKAFKLSLLGAKDTQIADFFGVSEVTLNTWKKKHPKFLVSINEGKEDADANVANSLYHRANGYSIKETKVIANPDDPKNPILIEIDKNFPPDTASAIFWLKNRQKKNWREKQEVEHSGKGITFAFDYGTPPSAD